MQVLYFSPVTWSNTDFYRTTGVLPFINYPEIILRDISHFGRLTQWDLKGADVLILQRPSTPDQLGLLKLAKQCGLKVVVDYDDDCLNVDKLNPTYIQYEQQKPFVKKCIEEANEVWTSTQGVKDSFGRGVIIPNALNDYLLPKCVPKSETNKVIWRGSSTHEADIYEHADEIVELINSHQELDFYFIGHRFTYLEQRCGDNFTSVDGMPLMQYFTSIRELNPCAMIFPLCDNLLNRSKSNISLIEATWCGAEYFGNKSLPEFNLPFVTSLEQFPNANCHANAVKYIEENLLLSQINSKRVNSLLTLAK